MLKYFPDVKTLLLSIILGGFIVAYSGGHINKKSVLEHNGVKAGMIMKVLAFCETEEAIKKFGEFAEATSSEDVASYRKFVMHPDIPCYDSRFLGARPVPGKLIQYEFSVASPDGFLINVWKFKDVSGKIGYTWISEKPTTAKKINGRDT